MSTTVTSFSIKDTRCFAGHQTVELAKVTLLVGENSTGKSTFLGCLNALASIVGLQDLNDQTNYFNRTPFLMGSFENIVRRGCASFGVGLGMRGDCFHRMKIEFDAGSGSQPRESKIYMQLNNPPNPTKGGNELTITRLVIPGENERWLFAGPGFEFELPQAELSYTQFTTWLSRSARYGLLPFNGDPSQLKRRTVREGLGTELAAFTKFVNFFRHQFCTLDTPPSICAIDPKGMVRQRYYDSDPLGVQEGHADLDAINLIAPELGLFQSIDLREHGPHQFEVLVNVSGEVHNLADVGFGVTSLLPLLSSLLHAPTNTMFLLQQPEIHIHPSGQAKLVELLANSDHRFVIETHSDHLVDWARILVTESTLRVSDVSIVYFERIENESRSTRVHQLSLDGKGNLRGQPRNYRQFFSQETSRLLGLPT